MEKKAKWMLGMGYFVQGMRCLPWMGVSFFLKDTLSVDPSTLQFLLNSANLPMLAKPLFGLLSDSHSNSRLLFISLAALLQALSWFAIAMPDHSTISLRTISICLLLSNLGASIAEVVNDAIVAEATKLQQPKSNETDLQSFVSTACSAGGVIGNLLGGLIINRVSPQKLFLIFGVLSSVQSSITASSSSNPIKKEKIKSESDAGFFEQLSKLKTAMKQPSVFRSVAWFTASTAAIPALTGTMFFYQTKSLKIDSSVLGISKVVGQAAMVAWSVAYDKRLKRIPARKVIVGVQLAMSALIFSDLLFVKGLYRRFFGVPDWAYVVLVSGLSEVVVFMKILPFSVVIAKICPRGCEGSVMAVVSSAAALSLIVSGFLGVALGWAVGVSSGDDFSGLPIGLLVQAVLTLLPLYWSSYIPGGNEETSDKQD